METIVERQDLRLYQQPTHCMLYSAAFPNLDKRIDFEFDSLNAGDVLKGVNFANHKSGPFQFGEGVNYEFVGVKRAMWKIPILDGLFFVLKSRSGDLRSAAVSNKHKLAETEMPFGFMVVYTGFNTSSCLVPRPNRTTQPVGIIKSFVKLYNVSTQRLALIDRNVVGDKSYAAQVAAVTKRYHNDMALDMLLKHAISNRISYNQTDIARITNLSPRLIRSTYNDKWLAIKEASNTNAGHHKDTLDPASIDLGLM